MASLGPLVTADWLGRQLHDDDLRIFDCRFYSAEPDRGRDEYAFAHIPGSKYLSLDDDLASDEGPGRHPLPEPGTFAAKLGAIGVGDEHTVIVYDQADGAMGARLWWMLRSLGHDRVALLDGGWASWVAEGRSTTAEIPNWAPASLSFPDRWAHTIDREVISSGEQALFLVDSRSPERYRGEEEPFDPIAGHIPGAFNLPYTGNTTEDGHFLQVAELQERFAAIDTSQRLVVYCGSGVTACNNILAMELAGIEQPHLYPGSWSDWCTSGGDVATVGIEEGRRSPPTG